MIARTAEERLILARAALIKAEEARERKAKLRAERKGRGTLTRGRERDNGYLAFLRRHPCACGCGRPAPSDAAHIRMASPSRGKLLTGMQVKPSDRFAVPLNRTCHEAQHSMSEARFWSSRGLDPFEIADRLFAEYRPHPGACPMTVGEVLGEAGALTVQSAAEILNGSEYGSEGSRELWAAMKSAGLVAVYGASDDLMEFSGAIDDELSAYGGTTALVTSEGLFEPCGDNCKYSLAAQSAAVEIDALWCAEDGLSWSYETDIPHATFNVMEDGAVYCRGIVFDLAALRASQAGGVE